MQLAQLLCLGKSELISNKNCPFISNSLDSFITKDVHVGFLISSAFLFYQVVTGGCWEGPHCPQDWTGPAGRAPDPCPPRQTGERPTPLCRAQTHGNRFCASRDFHRGMYGVDYHVNVTALPSPEDQCPACLWQSVAGLSFMPAC